MVVYVSDMLGMQQLNETEHPAMSAMIVQFVYVVGSVSLSQFTLVSGI